MPTCFLGLFPIVKLAPIFVTLDASVTKTRHSVNAAALVLSNPVSGHFLNKSSTLIVAPVSGLCLSAQVKFLQVGPANS